MALNNGYVKWRETDETGVDNSVLEQAIMLLRNDCFPIAIVCCCKEDRNKEILGTSIWKEIFSFLENKRTVRIAENDVLFMDMDVLERNKILSAHILSIWVKD